MKNKKYWIRVCGEFPAIDEGKFTSLHKAMKAAETASLRASVAFCYVMTSDCYGECFVETARGGKINTYSNYQF